MQWTWGDLGKGIVSKAAEAATKAADAAKYI